MFGIRCPARGAEARQPPTLAYVTFGIIALALVVDIILAATVALGDWMSRDDLAARRRRISSPILALWLARIGREAA